MNDIRESSHRNRRRARLRLIAASSLLGALLFTFPVAADPIVSEPTKIGTLSRFPSDVARVLKIPSMRETYLRGPDGSAVVDHGLDRIYQIWNATTHATLGTRIIVAERSLESFKLRRVFNILGKTALPTNNGDSGTEFVTALDTKNHRLFIEYGDLNFEPRSTGLVVIDLLKGTVLDKPWPTGLVRATYKGQVTFGLEYDEATDTLIAILAGFDETFQTTTTASLVGWAGSEFNLGGSLPGSPPNLLGPRILRGCRQGPIATVSSSKLSPIMIATGPDLASEEIPQPIKTWVVIPCLSTPFSVNTALIRMERSTIFNPQGSEETIAAPAGIANWVNDNTRGRMHLINASRETDDWVYEVKSNAFIGIIELSPKGELAQKNTGLGVDELTGRLYAFGLHLDSSGAKKISSLMISQAAQDPVPQADIFNVGGVDDAEAAILVDGKRNRVLVLPRGNKGASGPSGWRDSYTVYAVPPPLPTNEEQDPDSQTKQVAEDPARTTAEFGGTATAYGARLLLAAGVTGIIPSSGNDTIGQAYKDVGSRCGLRDREIVLGGFAQSSLAAGAGVDALAESVHLDDGSAQDFGKPSRCDLFYQYVGPVFNVGLEEIRKPYYFTGLMRFLDEQDAGKIDSAETICAQYLKDPRCTAGWEDRTDSTVNPVSKWEYRPAECGTPEQKDVPGQNSKYLNGETFVECTKENQVSSHAEGRADGVMGTTASPLPVKIGRATSDTSVRFDKAKGLISTATSRVENIVIGPVTIGFIENTAISYAHGRTGTARTEEYEPVIGLVKGPGITSCSIRCDIDQLIPQLNNALAGRAEFRSLVPDARLAKGSPGGYEAGIIKSEKQTASDNALVGDKSREVPALEVIVYNDNPRIGRARQVIQLAGVRADSHYGIQVFAEGAPCEPNCGPEIIQVPGPTVEVPGPTVEVPVAGPATTRTITKPGGVRYLIPGGYRLLLANPKAAGAMLTVWAFLAAPFIIAARRGRLG